MVAVLNDVGLNNSLNVSKKVKENKPNVIKLNRPAFIKQNYMF